MRFQKTHRLLNKAEYKTTLDQPHKISRKEFLLLFKANQKSHARLGLMVGKKVSALAVTRNLIKRVIRESFRVNQDQLQGWDVVVITRHPCGKLSKDQLREGMNHLWERLIKQYQKPLLP